MKVAAITCVRNDRIFLDRWISYYGSELGFENLYVFLDGKDQPLPTEAARVNIIQKDHVPLPRAVGDRRRALMVSQKAAELHGRYDCVIAVDVDEFLIPDPSKYGGLFDFLQASVGRFATLSGLGLDVGQNIETEQPLDLAQPFLGQRRYAHLSTRYTKPAISFQPVTWGSGYHRVKGQNYHIHPQLFLFHFGMIDYALSTGKTADKDRLAAGWGGHLERRERLFKIIAQTKPQPFDQATATARLLQTWLRPLYALNKPAMPGKPVVVEVPDRFFGIV